MTRKGLGNPTLAVARLTKEHIWRQLAELIGQLEEETRIERFMTGYHSPAVASQFQSSRQLTLKLSGEILEFVAQRTRWKVVHTLLTGGKTDGPSLQREVSRADIECSPPAFSKHINLLIDRGYVRKVKLKSGKELDIYELNQDSWKTRYICAVMISSKLFEDEVIDGPQEEG